MFRPLLCNLVIETCVISCGENDTSTSCPSHLYCDAEQNQCRTKSSSLCDSSSDCEWNQHCLGFRCVDAVRKGVQCVYNEDCGMLDETHLLYFRYVLYHNAFCFTGTLSIKLLKSDNFNSLLSV